MRNTILITALAAVMGLGVLSGCTPEAREKYDSAGESAADATKKTGDAVATDAAKTGQAVEKSAEAAGQAVKNAADNTAKAVDNSATTGSVKSALLTAKGLKTNNLNVDTIGNKIVLRGSVPDEAQKKQAENIALGIAGKQFTVENQLTIAPQ
ncbi:BON domain-containing protein [Fimbriimonas ginsengisoli]|uniref:Osmotically inducible periplasmic protein n=1 Tax=Fimbriimonas ginsengisoli Gsoil 348 TaxID=661478 RepID=A0A068NVX6_FIMGI|nr:BON domain-containing protein [Fimbriimonas ginsengisoli]AIE87512.1 osmotically inducible periplasmic protein [Fimbriimonas ginsengisoli Gsoil 348]